MWRRHPEAIRTRSPSDRECPFTTRIPNHPVDTPERTPVRLSQYPATCFVSTRDHCAGRSPSRAASSPATPRCWCRPPPTPTDSRTGSRGPTRPICRSCATGPERDRAAVEAALTVPYHGGRTEGVNQLVELLKRVARGRQGGSAPGSRTAVLEPCEDRFLSACVKCLTAQSCPALTLRERRNQGWKACGVARNGLMHLPRTLRRHRLEPLALQSTYLFSDKFGVHGGRFLMTRVHWRSARNLFDVARLSTVRAGAVNPAPAATSYDRCPGRTSREVYIRD